jgi:hypothetical protein
MGHKVSSITFQIRCPSSHGNIQQWYKRRKVDADCYVGEKFQDPEEHEENCPCDDDDFEWYACLVTL